MARVQKERKGKERKEKNRYYGNAQKRYTSYPCSEVPDDAIITKLGSAVDLIDVMTSAKFGDNRFKSGPSGDVQNLPISLYFDWLAS